MSCWMNEIFLVCIPRINNRMAKVKNMLSDFFEKYELSDFFLISDTFTCILHYKAKLFLLYLRE